MFNFFSSVDDFISTICNFISNFISGIVTAISVLLSAVTLPPALTGFVPSVLSTSIMVVGSIGVIKLIVGWGNK